MLGVVTDGLDYAKTFGTPLTEEKPIAWSKILRTLDEAERYSCAISCTDELAVDVDDSTGL